MKKTLLGLVMLSLFSVSAAHAGDKICMETRDGTMTNTPCMMGKKTSQARFLNMIFHNTEGYQSLVSPSNKERLEMVGFVEDAVRVTALSDGKDSHGLYKTVVQYEIAMDDCGTTDTCGRKFVWTVTETISADGYSTDLEYKNALPQVQAFPSWVKNQ